MGDQREQWRTKFSKRWRESSWRQGKLTLLNPYYVPWTFTSILLFHLISSSWHPCKGCVAIPYYIEKKTEDNRVQVTWWFMHLRSDEVGAEHRHTWLPSSYSFCPPLPITQILSNRSWEKKNEKSRIRQEKILSKDIALVALALAWSIREHELPFRIHLALRQGSYDTGYLACS